MPRTTERLKSFGQMFANDSAREILLLLFNRELTAAQISEKMGISLQLTKYHLHKMQELEVVEVFRISKNSKSPRHEALHRQEVQRRDRTAKAI